MLWRDSKGLYKMILGSIGDVTVRPRASVRTQDNEAWSMKKDDWVYCRTDMGHTQDS